MMNSKLVDELSARLSQLAAAGPLADVERNLRALMGGFFERLDLVTREEFDTQREVLAKAREKIALLDARVAELEARLPKQQ